MKKRHLVYPLIPKSADWLVPGQFWALPLSDGTFGCGRVIAIPTREHRISRMEFLAGVLDWHSPHEPTCESIGGARCLGQGRAHIRAITRIGGAILGQRDLAGDGIEPWLFRGAYGHLNSNVYLGLAPLRPQTAADQELPVLGTWGYDFAREIAEFRFVKK